MPIYIGLEFQQSPAFGRKVNGGMEWGTGEREREREGVGGKERKKERQGRD